MDFLPATDQLENSYYFRRVSMCGRLHIMIYPVLFGFRVRIGLTSDPYSVSIDACAGSDLREVNNLYNLFLLAFKRARSDWEVGFILRNFRSSEIKPYFNDEVYKGALYLAAGVNDEQELEDNYLVEIKPSDLHAIRIFEAMRY